MSKEDIINYVMTTPGNPNRAVLNGMLDNIEGSSNTTFVKITGTAARSSGGTRELRNLQLVDFTYSELVNLIADQTKSLEFIIEINAGYGAILVFRNACVDVVTNSGADDIRISFTSVNANNISQASIYTITIGYDGTITNGRVDLGA